MGLILRFHAPPHPPRRVADPAEACFLVSILNSETARALVADSQSKGQWGARDFEMAALLPKEEAAQYRLRFENGWERLTAA
jgi:hypothetical protein